MLKQIEFISIFVLLLSVGFLVSGCDNLKFTFGGTIPSARYDSARYESDSKANFGGIINACSCEEYEWESEDIGDGFCAKSNILYHDNDSSMYEGLKLKAKVVQVVDCSEYSGGCGEYYDKYESPCCTCARLSYDCEGGYPEFRLAAKISYRSQNPSYTNCKSGWTLKQKGVVCLVDNGEGYNAEDPDFAAIKIFSGPYAGYQNCGPVQGNVQDHDCRWKDAALESSP